MTSNGGPAFPCDPRMMRVEGDGMTITPIGFHGMSLRDWFAGQALVAVLNMDGIQYLNRYDDHAKAAYAQADAMLARRSTPEGN